MTLRKLTLTLLTACALMLSYCHAPSDTADPQPNDIYNKPPRGGND